MKPLPPSENDEQDQELIKLLQALGSLQPTYPPELLTARRAAFLAQVERLEKVKAEEGVEAGDEEMIRFLGNLKSATPEYPADLLAARRSAFLQQVEGAESVNLLDKLRASIKSLFPSQIRIPSVPIAGLRRTALVVAGFIATALIGSLLFRSIEQSFKPLPLEGVAEPTRALPTGTQAAATIICRPEDQTPPCPPREPAASQDLANQGNGAARPAISNAAPFNDDGLHQAAYVNDGRGGASWVSNSADSWIKIDLGKITTINSVSFQKGSLGSSNDNNPGQFVIAVALSDVYADGDSSNDYNEYAQVFNSEQLGFNGMVRNAETIRTLFPPVRARFVKMSFEKAGVAIEEVGVFMLQPPMPVEQSTRRPQNNVPGGSLTPTLAATLAPLESMTSVPTGTRLPFDTPIPTDTRQPSDTPTLLPTDTPLPPPTNTPPPAATTTPVPTNPLPLDTPTLLATVALPTASVLPIQPFTPSTAALIIIGNDQTLTFTCNDDAVEIRGHANTITLLGSCRSISVTGNGNSVFWQSGSPVITNRGQENIIYQR
jgi:hypothetical protein